MDGVNFKYDTTGIIKCPFCLKPLLFSGYRIYQNLAEHAMDPNGIPASKPYYSCDCERAKGRFWDPQGDSYMTPDIPNDNFGSFNDHNEAVNSWWQYQKSVTKFAENLRRVHFTFWSSRKIATMLFELFVTKPLYYPTNGVSDVKIHKYT